MKYFDLTQTISPNMPVYPDTKPPTFIEACSLKENGFKELEMLMYTHVGTHIDCPAHLFEDGLTLELLPIQQFIGKALVVDCTKLKPGSEITPDILQQASGKLSECDFLLFNTGWSKKWGHDSYFKNFPVLSPDLAELLSCQGLKGVGIDAISVEAIDSPELPIHKILLSKNIIIIENLTNLEMIVDGFISFSCFPLKIKGADGSPIRAVARLD